jgi:hypothetical protein
MSSRKLRHQHPEGVARRAMAVVAAGFAAGREDSDESIVDEEGVRMINGRRGSTRQRARA